MSEAPSSRPARPSRRARLATAAVLAAAGGGLLLTAARASDGGAAARDGGAVQAATVAAGAAPDTAPGTAERGAALFAGKGCSGCHVLGDLPAGIAAETAPDLTDYRGDLSFLRRWLADPPAVRPGTAMPDLGLTETEIEVLAAFLSGDRR